MKREFTIGASTIPGDVIMPRLMPELLKRRPEVTLKLDITNSRKTFERVRDGELEIGIIGTRYSSDTIEYQPITTGDQLVLIVPKDHPFAARSISLDSLRKQRFVSREPGSGTRASYEKALIDAGLPLEELDVVAEISNTDSVIQAVEAGVGISIVSRIAVQESSRCGNIAVVELPFPVTRDFYLITNKSRPLSPLAQEIRSLIETLASQH